MSFNLDKHTILQQVKKNSKKLLISLLSVLFLVKLYTVIWALSAQNSDDSSSLSMEVAMMLTHDIEKAMKIEFPIRKTAHFSEYMAMGVFIYGIWCCWLNPWLFRLKEIFAKKIQDDCAQINLKRQTFLIKRCMFINILWVTISAAADEFHQSFVPGRSPQVTDVLIDTIGGAFGLLCIYAFSRILYRLYMRFKKEA